MLSLAGACLVPQRVRLVRELGGCEPGLVVTLAVRARLPLARPGHRGGGRGRGARGRGQQAPGHHSVDNTIHMLQHYNAHPWKNAGSRWLRNFVCDNVFSISSLSVLTSMISTVSKVRGQIILCCLCLLLILFVEEVFSERTASVYQLSVLLVREKRRAFS